MLIPPVRRTFFAKRSPIGARPTKGLTIVAAKSYRITLLRPNALWRRVASMLLRLSFRTTTRVVISVAHVKVVLDLLSSDYLP